MKFSTFVIVVLIVLGGYAIVRIAPAYIKNYQINSIADLAAKMYADPARNNQMEHFLTRKFEDITLPIVREDIKIEDNDDTVKVYVDWAHTSVFIPKNQFVPEFFHVYRFHVEKIEKIRR